MLATYQFIPARVVEHLPNKAGGGFKFRYRSAYNKKVKSTQTLGQNKTRLPSPLNQNEINTAMNKIFQHGSPKNKARNTIIKPLAIDYDSDFEKLNSATQTVKNALELLTSIQRLKEEAELAEGTESGGQKTVIQGINLHRNQLQTAEAVTLVSNVTILPSPENANPGATKRTQINYRSKIQSARPHSGYEQNSKVDPKRVIDLEKISAIQPDIVRNTNGTLTPQNNIKRDQSGRALNTLLEFQSSHRSRQNLIKSTSNASKNADIEYLIKEKSQNFSHRSNDQLVNDEPVVIDKLELEAFTKQQIERKSQIEDVISPPSIEIEQSNKQNLTDLPKIQPSYYPIEQQFYPIAPQQIGQAALISEKAKFSYLAWNISLMKQDTYNILSSKDFKSNLNSERIPTTLEQTNQMCVIPQATQYFEQVDNNTDSKPLNSYISANQKSSTADYQVSDRPKLINLTDNTNIEMYLQRQSYEKQMIKMNSTAQLNKLSSGAINQHNNSIPLSPNRMRSPLSAGFNRPQSFKQTNRSLESKKQKEKNLAGRNFAQHVITDDLVQIQRGQPVKVKVMLSQANDSRFREQLQAKNLQVRQKISNLANMNIETDSLTEAENVVFKLPNSQREQQNSHRLQVSTQRENLTQNFNTAIISDENQQDEVSELKKQVEIKSSIVYKKKQNNLRKSQEFIKSTKEVNQLVDNNFKEFDARRQQETLKINNDLVKEGAFLKPKESQPNRSKIGSKITTSDDKRASTLLEGSEQKKQKIQKQVDTTTQWYLLPNTPFTQVCQELPSAINQGAVLNTGNSVIQESKVLVQDQQKSVPPQTTRQQPQNRLSNVQRRTFNQKLVGLARIINNQTDEENLKFTQQYTNLMEKHTVKNWVQTENKPTEVMTNQGKSQRTIMSGRTAQSNNTLAKKNVESGRVFNPLSFLGLQNIVNCKQTEATMPRVVSGVKINGIQRPKTTKSSVRVAIIQEKLQPLPPPSARNQRRVGADMNFLKPREESAIERQNLKRGVLDLRMSNFQIIFRNSSETTYSTQLVPISLPMSSKGQQAFEKESSEGHINFVGQERAGKPNSLLFSQLNIKNK